ncbi:hypothetical protein [Streptomyces sp. NPDC000851]
MSDRAAVTWRAPSALVRAVAEGIGARAVATDSLGDDGTLAAWLRDGRADAVLLRPDRSVLDTVPAGAGCFTDIAGWVPLLCTARRPVPDEQAGEACLTQPAYGSSTRSCSMASRTPLRWACVRS